MNKNPSAPIGIFDSGIGGLTVVKAVQEALPNENIIYFGDTARVPYGIKSVETVKQYGLQITDFLLKHNVKLILIACNTVSAIAEELIKARALPIPVLGVVASGSQAAADAVPGKGHVAVLGTLATIGSGAYEKSIRALNNDIQVFSRACPLLVPLAEEGWTDNEVAEKTLEIYLHDIKKNQPDALILGCTHYPLFKDAISKILNELPTKIIDSAETIAQVAKTLLQDSKMHNTQSEIGHFDCYVSDKPQRFQILAERFLGKRLTRIELVMLD